MDCQSSTKDETNSVVTGAEIHIDLVLLLIQRVGEKIVAIPGAAAELNRALPASFGIPKFSGIHLPDSAAQASGEGKPKGKSFARRAHQIEAVSAFFKFRQWRLQRSVLRHCGVRSCKGLQVKIMAAGTHAPEGLPERPKTSFSFSIFEKLPHPRASRDSGRAKWVLPRFCRVS